MFNYFLTQNIQEKKASKVIFIDFFFLYTLT